MPAYYNGFNILSLSCVGGASNRIFKRTGTTWTFITPSGSLPTVRHGPSLYVNGTWLCSGTNGAVGQIGYSMDGETWYLVSGVGNPINTHIAWVQGHYIMCGTTAAGAAVTSIYYANMWNLSFWTAQTVPSGIYKGVAEADLGNGISAGIYTILTVPDTTHFTFYSMAPDRAASTGLTTACTPVGVGFLDTVPDTFVGAAIYTAPGQETILQQNDRPVACRDIAHYRNFTFWAAPTPFTSLGIALISIGGVTGLRSGDTVTINGHAVSAGVSENSFAAAGTLTFQVFNSTSRTPSQNIADTAASLMRVINRNSSTFHSVLVDTTSIDGVPGQMTIRTMIAGQSTTFAFTSTVNGTPWSPAKATTIVSETKVNELRWAKANQPDASPVLNSIRVGANDKAIVRIVSTRASLFVFKEDGIYQLTGAVPPFQLDPFDLTTNICGAETAVPLDNQVYLLAQNGIQRVSDTGTTLISRPIDPPLAKLLDATNRPVVKDVAFGIGSNVDHKYFLWLPYDNIDGRGWQFSNEGDTPPDHGYQAFVYDYFTDAFFHRDDEAYCGEMTWDDRLILGTPQGTEVERKDFANTDYQDDLVGDGTTQVAIATDVEWNPKFGQDPAALNHFQEIGLLFRTVYFDVATLTFVSSVAGVSPYSITLDGTAYGLVAAGTEQFALRALVPPECGRAGLLKVRLRHAVLRAPMKIQALSVSFNPGPTRFGR